MRIPGYLTVPFLVTNRYPTDSHFPLVLEVVLGGGLRKSLCSLMRRTISSAHSNVAPNSIIELQAFIARLVREFQFSEVKGKPITMWRPGLVVPTVRGEEDKGPQLPLRVSAVRRN